MLRKKSFLKSFQGHPRSIKVIWVYCFFCIPIGYHVVKNDENMKMSHKDMPTCSELGNLGPFGPTVMYVCMYACMYVCVCVYDVCMYV